MFLNKLTPLTKKNEIPRSGLNFLFDEKKQFSSRFLLLCGFEKFKNFYVRVDILEKLFIKIIEKSDNGKFKIDSEMMNLLGCTKENFFRLMDLMNYKKQNSDENVFVYKGSKKEKKMKKSFKKINNPFKKLESLSFK